MDDPRLLLKEFLRTPAKIGAVCPSSPFLRDTMCAMLPRKRDGLIVEVGPGTGAITTGLVRRASARNPLVLVERSALLAENLRRRYPQLQVITGDAAQLPSYLGVEQPVAAIVSTLPLLNMSHSQRMAILEAFRIALRGRGRLVLMTYNMFCHPDMRRAGFVSRYHRVEMRNIPPARVDCFLPLQM